MNIKTFVYIHYVRIVKAKHLIWARDLIQTSPDQPQQRRRRPFREVGAFINQSYMANRYDVSLLPPIIDSISIWKMIICLRRQYDKHGFQKKNSLLEIMLARSASLSLQLKGMYGIKKDGGCKKFAQATLSGEWERAVGQFFGSDNNQGNVKYRYIQGRADS